MSAGLELKLQGNARRRAGCDKIRRSSPLSVIGATLKRGEDSTFRYSCLLLVNTFLGIN